MASQVLITTSPYTTLLYFLVNDLDEIKQSNYFFIQHRKWTDQDKNHIQELLPNSYFLNEKPVTAKFRSIKLLFLSHKACQIIAKRIIPYLTLRLTKNHRWPFLKNSTIYAYDDISICSALIGSSDYIFVEEGLYTYENADVYAGNGKFSRMLVKKIEKFLNTPFGIKGLALNNQAKKLILTGLSDIPKCYSKKNLEIISIPDLWKKSNDEKKSFIMKFFNLSVNDLDNLRKRDIIFIEQAFSSDGYITRDEQIEMIRKIIEKYNAQRIVLKTHYRSTINYREIFPELFVWDKLTPMELMNLCGIKFTKAITVNSTAVSQLPDDVKIEWLGLNMNSELFSHLSNSSRAIMERLSARMPIPNRIKNQKEN